MFCLGDRQRGDWGPRRVSHDERRHRIAHGWEIDSIEEAVREITISPGGAQA
jgi:hypothetical protein